MPRNSSFSFRLDEQVVYTMAGLCLISILVLAFRFVAAKPCTGVHMRFGSDTIYTGEMVHFSTRSQSGKSFFWDFGDGQVQDKKGASISHIYKEPRSYMVKVVADGECMDLQTLVVMERKKVVPVSTDPMISFPEIAMVDTPVKFFDESRFSTKWEWYFEENPQVFGRTREVLYTFKKPGTQKILVKVNGQQERVYYIAITPKPDDVLAANFPSGTKGGGKKGTQVVVIKDRPLEDPLGIHEDSTKPVPTPVNPIPAPKKAPEISAPDLAAALEDLAKGSKSLDFFNDFFCGFQDVVVTYEGKTYSFSDFHKELKEIKAKKIKSINVTVLKKNQNNCITAITVDIKRKLFGVF